MNNLFLLTPLPTQYDFMELVYGSYYCDRLIAISYFLHYLLTGILGERLVASPAFTYVFSYLCHYGIRNIYVIL